MSATFDEQEFILATVKGAAQDLVDLCERNGIVVTIVQQPVEPLAMGNYKTVIAARLKRGTY